MRNIESRNISVRLINVPKDALYTLYAMWYGTRLDAQPMSSDEFYHHFKMYKDDSNYSHLIPSLSSRNDVVTKNKTSNGLVDFKDSINSIILDLLRTPSIPVINSIQLTFEFNDVPVKWREQAIRAQGNVYWVQTSRIFDYSKHFPYFTPSEITNFSKRFQVYRDKLNKESFETATGKLFDESFDDHGMYYMSLDEKFRYKLAEDQREYQEWRDAGVSIESSNLILSEACRTHRVYASYRLRDLTFAMGKRACFIAHGDLWQPVLAGIASELRKYSEFGLDLLADALFTPPCKFDKSKCPNTIEANARINGNDPLPVCPVYSEEDPKSTWKNNENLSRTMLGNYSKMWSDPKIFDKVYIKEFTNA